MNFYSIIYTILFLDFIELSAEDRSKPVLKLIHGKDILEKDDKKGKFTDERENFLFNMLEQLSKDKNKYFEELGERIKKYDIPEYALKTIQEEISRLKHMSPRDMEYNVTR